MWAWKWQQEGFARLDGLHSIVEMSAQGQGLDEGLAEPHCARVAQPCHEMPKDEVVWGNLWQSSTSTPCVSSMCPVRLSCSRAGAAGGLPSCTSIKPLSLLPLVDQPHFHKLAGLPKQGQGFVLAEGKNYGGTHPK